MVRVEVKGAGAVICRARFFFPVFHANMLKYTNEREIV